MVTALDDVLGDGLAPLGVVSIRRMFGGAGVFIDGLMMGIVADDVLFLKADATTQPRFEAEGLGQLTYAKQGRTIAMAYWQAPERLLDDPEELVAWCREALAVARRAQTKAQARSRAEPGSGAKRRPSRPRRPAK